jgi:tetratricopeptide (TPR) repeat protein
VDTDPQGALAHAYAARAHAARIGAVREAVGITAYHAGEWAVALSELRAVRRMNGAVEHLPVEADCERALGRPDRALELWRSPIAQQLDDAARIELLIVAAGARRDLGQHDSAVVMLQVPDLDARPLREWSARLRYAYADALLEAGRADEARTWFERTLEIDRHDETGASDRLLQLDGVLLDDAFDEDPEADEPEETDEGPVDEILVDEAQVDEARVGESEADEGPVDEAQVDEARVGESEADEGPVDEILVDEAQVDEARVGDGEADEILADETEPREMQADDSATSATEVPDDDEHPGAPRP